MAIARDVAVITKSNTEDPFYKALFPTSPSTATAPVAGGSQNLFVKALIDRIETDNRFENLRPRAADLKQSQAELDKALIRRDELCNPEMRALVDLEAALASARRMYNKLYPRLTLIFDSKGFIETFFTPLRKPSSAVETEADLPEEEEAAEE